MQRFFIKTKGVYAAIADAASSMNVAGFLQRELAAADEMARLQGCPDGEGLHFFNGRLAEYAERGDMMTWTFLFHGLYQVIVEVIETVVDAPAKLPPIENVGQQNMQADLYCGSGRFLIADLDQLGVPSSNIITVTAGWYRVTFTYDGAMECKHSLLEDIAEYPPDDRAAWYLTLQPIQAPVTF